jgi:hypothetical protein
MLECCQVSLDSVRVATIGKEVIIMNITYFRSATAVLAVAGLITIASTDALAGQGRPSTPPGQTNRPATPPARGGGSPQTPPGHAKAQTPPGQAKVAVPLVVKPALMSTLQPLLPGRNITAEAQGFKTLGAFVSAVHVSHNLEIPFDTLKAKIVTDGATLGSAIQTLKPTANVKAEVERAEKQARDDIARSNAR